MPLFATIRALQAAIDAPELQRLYHDYSPRVTFPLVYPDRASAEGIQKHMAAYGYAFGALRDGDRSLVKLAKARVTPEAASLGEGSFITGASTICALTSESLAPSQPRITSSTRCSPSLRVSL